MYCAVLTSLHLHVTRQRLFRLPCYQLGQNAKEMKKRKASRAESFPEVYNAERVADGRQSPNPAAHTDECPPGVGSAQYASTNSQRVLHPAQLRKATYFCNNQTMPSYIVFSSRRKNYKKPNAQRIRTLVTLNAGLTSQSPAMCLGRLDIFSEEENGVHIMQISKSGDMCR